MRKNTKCVDIFEENKKNLDLYQISVIIILVITLFQIGINLIRYTQLKSYMATHNTQQILQNQQVNNKETCYNENLHTQKCNINLSKLEEVSSIIGMKKIENMYSDSNQVVIQGYCRDINILKKISDLESIREFNIKSLEKLETQNNYLFNIEYKYRR